MLKHKLALKSVCIYIYRVGIESHTSFYPFPHVNYNCLFAFKCTCLKLRFMCVKYVQDHAISFFSISNKHVHIFSLAKGLIFSALDGTVHMAVKTLLNTVSGSKRTNISYDQLFTLCFVFRLLPIRLALLPWEQV